MMGYAVESQTRRVLREEAAAEGGGLLPHHRVNTAATLALAVVPEMLGHSDI